MKLQVPFTSSFQRGASASGFTLAEALVAMAVFGLVVGGVIFAHLFGLRMFQITNTKLSATDEVRSMMGKMVDEIRTSKSTWIGNVKNGVFEAKLAGEVQRGSGLLICPTTNTANFIVYFVNPSDKTFRRTTSVPGTTTVLAESITNSFAFQAQDHLGNVLTNNQNNRVIHLNLEFFQPPRYLLAADHYKVETSVTRRSLGL